MKHHQFSVPGTPKGKGRPRFGRGRAYTPKPTADYERLVRQCAYASLGEVEPLSGPVYLSVTATFPIAKSWPVRKKQLAEAGFLWHTARPDSDNILKIVCDALNEILWLDDSQICLAKISKKYGREPGVIVVVEEIE